MKFEVSTPRAVSVKGALMLLRVAADRRTIGFLLVFAALVCGGWWLDPTGWARVAYVGLTCCSSWLCAVIAHNTVHTPMFFKRWQNRFFQVWVSLSYGFPVSEYVTGHNLSHHKFTQRPEDMMRTSKVNYSLNVLNFLLFFGHIGYGVTVGNYRYHRAMKARFPEWNEQMLLEAAAVWAVKLGLLALDWRKALLYYLVPNAFAVWGITTINFLQHDGTDETSEVNHSRNFVGRLFNWFTLNNGYHGIHHRFPGLHWSQLAQAHQREFHGTVHPALEQRSLAVYLFKAFVYPGKRVTFDGRPVCAQPVPDADWVAASQSIEPAELGAVGTGL